MVQFDEPDIVGRLARLSRRGRSTFALGCAKRLDPLLEELDPEDRAIARDCRELLERVISGEDSTESQLSQALAHLESLETLDVDAVASVAYALRAWLNDSPQDAAWAARRKRPVITPLTSVYVLPQPFQAIRRSAALALRLS